jgi:hypothetical protein
MVDDWNKRVFYVSMSDRRVGYCFLQTIGGRCTARTLELRTVTKADCCCTMGAAWGPHCEICPTRDSDNYNELCLDKGFSVNGQGIESSALTLSISFAISTLIAKQERRKKKRQIEIVLYPLTFRYRRVQNHT